MLRAFVVACILFFSSAAYSQSCPTPMASDAGKVCVANADGTASWSDQLQYNTSQSRWDIRAPLWSTVPDVNGTYNFFSNTPVGSSNVVGYGGVTPFGNADKIAQYDCCDSLVIGPNFDNGRTSIFTSAPINIFKRHVVWDFNEAAIPPGLNLAQIGNGSTYTFPGDSRINITTQGIGAGDGGSLVANNTLTTLARRTQLYFVLNVVNEDRDTDLQFGVRDGSGSNQVRFRYAAGSSSHSSLVATVTNGSLTSSVVTSFTEIAGRHVFMLQWVPNGDTNFYCGDSNNVLQLCATIPSSNTARPNVNLNLVPFMLFRTNDAPAVRTVSLDTIYAIFEW